MLSARLLLSAFLLLSPIVLSAQWIPTAGPIALDRPIYDIEIIGDQVWLSNNAFYSMPLDGDAWTNHGYAAYLGAHIEPAGAYYLLAAGGGVTRYGIDGTAGATEYMNTMSVESLASGIFIGSSGKVFVSTDTGETYQRYSTGLSNRYLISIAESGSSVFAGTDSGIYRSIDTGKTWLPTSGFPGRPAVFQMAGTETTVLAATYDGLYRSTDAGTTWTRVSAPFSGDTVTALTYESGRLFAGSGHGLYRSDDAGATWRRRGLDSVKITALAISGSYIVAGSATSGTWRSTDGGTTWENIRKGLAAEHVSDVVSFKGQILAAGEGTIWRTGNKGETWEPGIGASVANWMLGASASTAFAVGATGLYTSTDGIHWSHIDSTAGELGVAQIHEHKGTLFVSGVGTALYRFDNPGWTRLDPGPDDLDRFTYMTSYGDSLVAAANNGVYFSTDLGRSWRILGAGLPSPTAGVGRVFTMGRRLFVSLVFGLYSSSDAGATWDLHSDITGINDILVAGNGHLYARTTRLVESADSGRTWTPIDTGIEAYETHGLAILDDELYTGLTEKSRQSDQDGAGVWKMPVEKGVSRVWGEYVRGIRRSLDLW